MFVNYYNKWYGFWISLDQIILVIIGVQLLCCKVASLILFCDEDPSIVKKLTGIKQSKLRAILKEFVWYQIALLALNICIMYKLQIFINEYFNHTNQIQTPIINILYNIEIFFNNLAFIFFGGGALYFLLRRL